MSVTSKKWRLAVTPLNTTTPLHQLEVEAVNWMGALREARRELGEDGGLPTGASCAVAPDGTVTILDSESRRKFLLTPAAAGTGLGSSASVTGMQAQASRTSLSSPSQAQPHALPSRRAPDKKRGDTLGYGDMQQAMLGREPGDGRDGERDKDHDPLELLFIRDEEPTSDNPLTYRERAYLIPANTTVSEAEAQLRYALAEVQRQLAKAVRGKLVTLAAFDHRWVEQPERPPLVVLEWRDWRGEPAVDYPAAEQRSRSSPARTSSEPDDRLASIFEALHDLSQLQTPHEALGFAVNVLENTVPAAAISGCLYDINTDELRFVAATGPGADTVRGTAHVNRGLFARAARSEHSALVVQTMSEAPDYDPDVDGRPGLSAENLLLRPVVHEGRLLGMLQFINRTSGTFSGPDVHLVNYTADRLGEFLHQAHARARH